MSFLGKHHSEESKRKMSKAHKGKSLSEMGHKLDCQCPFCKSKRGEFKDRKLSKKHRENISRAKKGEKNPMWGKHPSEKTREKLRLSHINTAKGKNHFNWKGGQIMHEGYIFVLMPEHPKANSNKGYVKRARLVAEKKLGRYLYPGEITHHKNEIKDDDRPENIQVMESISEHVKYHRNLKN